MSELAQLEPVAVERPAESAPKPVARSAEADGAYAKFRHSLLRRDVIRKLSELKPRRAAEDIVLCWGLILAAFWFVAVERNWWAVLIAMPVIGNRYYGLFIIGHDGMHRRLLRSVKRNDFWNDLLILAPIGAITRINNRNHLKHHRLLATTSDPDRHKYRCTGKNDEAELVGHISGVTSVWRSASAVFLAHEKQAGAEGQAGGLLGMYTARDLAMLAAWFVALAGGLSWLVGWWAYPVLWLVPVYLFMYLGDNLRSFAEHSQPQEDQGADEHRLITYESNPLERMLVSPMNMNYHAAHHLWPSIPYYNLPMADALMRASPEAAGLEWRKTYVGYLLRYWKAVPIAGCESQK
jgi:fatty acid desaturase